MALFSATELLRTTLDNSILLKIMILLVQLKASNILYNRSPGVQCRRAAIHRSRNQYSPTIKEKLTEKGKFRKLWQINRCPVLKNKLNRAIKALTNLLDLLKEIREYKNI